jgi:hypothetical protein
MRDAATPVQQCKRDEVASLRSRARRRDASQTKNQPFDSSMKRTARGLTPAGVSPEKPAMAVSPAAFPPHIPVNV